MSTVIRGDHVTVVVVRLDKHSRSFTGSLVTVNRAGSMTRYHYINCFTGSLVTVNTAVHNIH